ALQRVLEGGQYQSGVEQRLRQLVVVVVETAMKRGEAVARRQLDAEVERVLRLLHFLAETYFGVLHTRRPLDVVDAVDFLQHHRDALEAVGELRRNRRELDAAGLLEVRELRDLEAVEEHLPADSPRAERGGFPVVFLEADVVLPGVDA